jgi:hypothetical protein
MPAWASLEHRGVVVGVAGGDDLEVELLEALTASFFWLGMRRW